MFTAAGIPCEAVADLLRARWEKLVWNIPFNGLSALLGKDVTRLLDNADSRRMIEQIMFEVAAGANAQGLTDPIDGPAFCRQLIRFSEQMDHYQPSMLLDRLAGRPLELEAIYQIPLQQALAAGVEMPRTAMLHSLLEIGEED
jgi:2-dehydropantoate 2-reductase